MILKKEFQPIHITLESKDDLEVFQNVFYSYIKCSPSLLNRICKISTHDQKVQYVFDFLESYRT